jgi:predicted transcriptional regulator
MKQVKKECEILDRILDYLDNNRSTFPDIQEICEKCQMDYDKSLTIRLEHDGYIDNIAKSRDGDGFKITKKGEYFINYKKGYCNQSNGISESKEPARFYSWAKEHSWLIGIILTIMGLIITMI